MKANNLRRGNVIMYNNAPYRVIEFQHVTPGKGRAKMQTKLRNLLAGNQTEVSFAATEDVQLADVRTTDASYLYSDHSGYHFMISESYEQSAMSPEMLGDAVYYLQDGMQVKLTLYEENPIGVELPPSVVLTVVETEPELKGSTATNSPKPAKTETGLSISVPPFIQEGERIVVNTDDGSYISRAQT